MATELFLCALYVMVLINTFADRVWNERCKYYVCNFVRRLNSQVIKLVNNSKNNCELTVPVYVQCIQNSSLRVYFSMHNGHKWAYNVFNPVDQTFLILSP